MAGLALAALTLVAATISHAQCIPANSVGFRFPVTVAPGIRATLIANKLTTPRGVTVDSLNNVLVIERGLGVTAFTEDTAACPGGWLRSVVVNNTLLTQGIDVDGRTLYVSTSGEVLRYVYDPKSRTVASGAPTTIISGIPPDGELTTRPLLLHGSEILVSSSLAENIDPTARNPSSGRSQIRSFPLPSRTSNTSQDFFSGSLLAYGIRNPAGFQFRGPQHLWVVDNGASIDNVTSLTTAFVNDNPADELNLVQLPKGNKRPGSAPFYGFPDCTTIWNATADPAGDPQYTKFHTGEQFSLNLEAERNDSWCQNVKNNVPPSLSFQAHSVPLDLKFYREPAEKSKASLPASWKRDAFVSFHGSFNRSPPTGYGVVRVPFNGDKTKALSSSQAGYEFIIQATNLTACPQSCIRPVGLAFGKDGRLFVTSDSSGELFVLSKSS